MRVKELIQILSSFTKEHQDKEILIDSYGNLINITTVDYDEAIESYVITFEKSST